MDLGLGLGTGEEAVDLPKATSTQVGANGLLPTSYVSIGLSIANFWLSMSVSLSLVRHGSGKVLGQQMAGASLLSGVGNFRLHTSNTSPNY